MHDMQTKLKALEREIKMRRGLYPRWVATGRMSQEEATREIQIFEEIANDYRAQLKPTILNAG